MTGWEFDEDRRVVRRGREVVLATEDGKPALFDDPHAADRFATEWAEEFGYEREMEVCCWGVSKYCVEL